MALHIEVVNHESNGENGQLTFTVRVLETDAEGKVVGLGPVEHCGIDPHGCIELNGDYEKFIMKQAPGLIARYKAVRHHAEHGPKFKGKRFHVEP